MNVTFPISRSFWNSDAKVLRRYAWVRHYEPWVVSAVSFLEIQLLTESGRLRVRNPKFTETVLTDRRFAVDDVPSVALFQKSLDLSWTRDPFDRLLAAHSLTRRLPLCTADTVMLDHHKLLVPELR